jgi:hypothetical protein
MMNKRITRAMRTICILFIAALTLIGAEAPRTFTGVVTDTMCGAKSHPR